MEKRTFIHKALSTCLAMCCAGIFYLQAQDTTYIYPTKDATIDSYKASANYDANTYFIAEVTPSTVFHSFIEVDLSTIPSGVYVTSAKMTLYGDGHVINGNTNACHLKRVTSSWKENEITWNDQPSKTTVDAIVLGESTSSNQDYVVDITLHVRDMLLNNNNDGFVLELKDPGESATLKFASSDHGTSSKHPVVEVIYETPDPIVLAPFSYHVLCESLSSGAVELDVTGGIAPYTYAWDDGGEGSWTTQDVSDLPAGDYEVTVTDALNVTAITTVGIGYGVELNGDQHDNPGRDV